MKDWLSRDWFKSQLAEAKAEQAQIQAEKQVVAAAKLARRDLLIEVADVVIQLRVAAERLEEALAQVVAEDHAKAEDDDDEQ